jgi:hypothetical protein
LHNKCAELSKTNLRAVWIASSKYRLAKSGTDPIEKQKADYLEILDTYKN